MLIGWMVTALLFSLIVLYSVKFIVGSAGEGWTGTNPPSGLRSAPGRDGPRPALSRRFLVAGWVRVLSQCEYSAINTVEIDFIIYRSCQ